MQDFFYVLLLIVPGLLLLLLEVFIFPGVLKAGILGIILTIAGVILSYTMFGTFWGTVALSASFSSIGLLIGVGVKHRIWERFMLEDSIKGGVNISQPYDLLSVGKQGITLTALRPSGTAEFDGESFEVKSTGGFIDQKTPVEITQIKGRQITVKPI
ncbi:MAG: hypothetical protein JJT94_10100 [Bernardetiaceae bacterium]|nr:hypothetical protein [Bernardetiaceae bacterium]